MARRVCERTIDLECGEAEMLQNNVSGLRQSKGSQGVAQHCAMKSER